MLFDTKKYNKSFKDNFVMQIFGEKFVLQSISLSTVSKKKLYIISYVSFTH